MRHLTPVPSGAARPRAFTLVELLVVIGIITVLVAMLLPVLKRTREQARLVQCGSNLRQIAMAFQMYANENRGYAPQEPVANTYTSAWMLQILPYVQVQPDGITTNWGDPNTWAVDRVPLYQCPSTYPEVFMWGTSCYGANDAFTVRRDQGQYQNDAATFWWWMQQPVDRALKMTDARVLARGSEWVLLGESVHPSNIMPSWNAIRLVNFLHARQRNYVFLDGHVEFSRPPVDYVIWLFNSGTVQRGRDNHAGTPPYNES